MIDKKLIGEDIDCLELGVGTIIEMNDEVAKIFLEEYDEVIELPLDELEEEEELEELSNDTLKSYIKKAGREAANHDDGEEHLKGLSKKFSGSDNKKAAAKAARDEKAKSEKRFKGMSTAFKKMKNEEAEQVDELSKGTLAKYIKRANDSTDNAARDRSKYLGWQLDKDPDIRNVGNKRSLEAKKKLDNRRKGIARAADKLAKEETEKLDELSQNVLRSYAKAAKPAYQGSLAKFGRRGIDVSKADAATAARNADNRAQGLATAKAKMNKTGKTNTAEFGKKKAKVAATEEIQIDELSDKTLTSYMRKAGRDIQDRSDKMDAAKGMVKAGKAYAEKEGKDDRPGKKAATAARISRYKSAGDAEQKKIGRRAAGIGKAASKMKEETQVDEARGRPPKEPAAGQKPTKAWLRHLERKKGGQEKTEIEALGAQLHKASSINRPVTFANGEKKEVTNGHAERFRQHMDARKRSTDKAEFQKAAHASHASFMKHVKSDIPKG